MMSGSKLINQKRHIGLQQLAALGAISNTLLGPNRRPKFIHNELSGESTLVCSCFRLLEHLDLSCSVGQLVCETVQAHQKSYRSGTGCLLFLAGAWSTAALECLHRDISIPHIISAMSEGLEICLNTCSRISISIEDVLLSVSVPEASDSFTASPRVPHLNASETLALAPFPRDRTTPVLSGNKKQRGIKLTHSRHFCTKDPAQSENNMPTSLAPSPDSKNVDIAHLASALGRRHGEMKLLVESSNLQSKNTGSDVTRRGFDVNKLVTCILPGLSEDHACVVPGCVVLLSAEHATLARELREQRLQIALFNGDLSVKYRHLGFNKTDMRLVADKLDVTGLSTEDEWMDHVLKTLLKLNVNLVLVNGVVNERLAQQCMRHRILVIERMKPAILKDFADTTGAVPVTYATQLSRHCIGTGVQVTVWRDCSGNGRKASMAINVVADHTALVTVVLCSSIHGKLQVIEDQFWDCAYRLHHALKERKLLPGAGETELLCLHHLQKHREDIGGRTRQETTGNPYRDTVLQLMGDAWMDFISTIMFNNGWCSKVEAWTIINKQLEDLNRGLCADVPFSRLFLRDDTGNGRMSHDLGYSDGPVGKIYDNVSVKMEAWRTALDLVFLVLQTDTEIITGVDANSVEANVPVL